MANGLLHVAIREGLIDPDFIRERTTGFEAVRHVVASYWPDRVERITGVPAVRIVQTARLLGEARTAIILTGRGPEQQTNGVGNVLGLPLISRMSWRARWMAPRKCTARLSYRVAMARNCLSLAKKFSIR